MKLVERCDVIEGCYEFMLAYAAQGVADGTEIREYLGRAVHALTGLRALLTDLFLIDEVLKSRQRLASSDSEKVSSLP